MPALTLESRLRIAESVAPRLVGDEVVMMDLESGVYFGLNPVGSRIWELVSQKADLRAVLEVMQAEYEVAPEILQRDLIQLVQQLVDKRLLVLVQP